MQYSVCRIVQFRTVQQHRDDGWGKKFGVEGARKKCSSQLNSLIKKNNK